MQMQSDVNQERWTMVLARESRADGRFVYAVKSTGIFCRPTCPSRRPRRELVEFFDSPAQAQQAGYRACRRCAPADRNQQVQKVEAACRYIDASIAANSEVPLSLTAIARHVKVSPFHFQRLFKRILGISPREYQQARRAGKFKSALAGEMRITDAIYEAGYSSSSRAYESIPAQLGMTPSEFRNQGQGTEIRYAILPTELGKLLVATTACGLSPYRFTRCFAVLPTLPTFRWTFKARLSSKWCGRHCGASLAERRAVTRRSRRSSANPKPCGQWPMLAPRTRWLSSYRVIV